MQSVLSGYPILSISGISYAVKGFEASHPQLVGVVNEICMILARMGI